MVSRLSHTVDLLTSHDPDLCREHQGSCTALGGNTYYVLYEVNPLSPTTVLT